MGISIDNRIWSVVLLTLFNSTLLFSKSNDIFRNEISRLDSMKINSSHVLISDSNSIVFFHLMKSIFPKDFYFRVNEFSSIEMDKENFSSCKSFLLEHQDRIEFALDSLEASIDIEKQYKRIPEHSFQISAIHFLDREVGKDVFDFDSICKYYFSHIRNNRQSWIGCYDLDSNDYLFLITISQMANESFGWDIHKWYIQQKILKDYEAWCASSSLSKDAQLHFFDAFCLIELHECFSLESTLIFLKQ